MKTYKLTIGRIQSAENNQSKEENHKQISGPVRKQRNDKRYRNKDTTKSRSLSGKTKSTTGTPTPTRRRRKIIREINQVRASREDTGP